MTTKTTIPADVRNATDVARRTAHEASAEDLTDAERALLVAAGETFVRGMRKGASDEEFQRGVSALRGLRAYALDHLGMV